MEIMGTMGASNAQFRDFAMTQQRQEAEIGQFQRILTNAMERQTNPVADVPQINRAEIREAAEKFESYFINLMFREMRRTTQNFNEGSFIPQSHAERIFTEMLDEAVAEDAARAGGIGLADMIYRQMTWHLD